MNRSHQTLRPKAVRCAPVAESDEDHRLWLGNRRQMEWKYVEQSVQKVQERGRTVVVMHEVLQGLGSNTV
ncbi:unnamed protein product [Haemonchus placei]|uniref:Ketol-acid reductoisomerase (NADP(+)) n=1 Tax=Haemonchus placei TaxID=6290 RepID=A0A0N4WYB0_HAEPC|nr:unnamed protein product [Haemonchus placei]